MTKSEKELLEACKSILDDLNVVMSIDLVEHFGASKNKLLRAIEKANDKKP